MKKLLKRQNALHYLSRTLYFAWLIYLGLSFFVMIFFDDSGDKYIIYNGIRWGIFGLLGAACFLNYVFLDINANKINAEVTKHSQQSYGKAIDTLWTKKYIDRNKLVRKRFILIFLPIFLVFAIIYTALKIIIPNFYFDKETVAVLQSIVSICFVLAILSGGTLVVVLHFAFKVKLVEIDGHLLLIYPVAGNGKIFCDDKHIFTGKDNKMSFALPESETRIVYLHRAIYKNSDEVDSNILK